MKLEKSESAERNKTVIADVLATVLPNSGQILEIASGTGQHVTFFATLFPHLNWIPSEWDKEKHPSILGHIKEEGIFDNIANPLHFDVREIPWPIESAEFVLSINMIHASEKGTCQKLFEGAQKILSSEGRVFLYGPFKFKDGVTAESNLKFNETLKTWHPEYGLYYFEDVVKTAKDLGFHLTDKFDMPANNLSLVFEKQRV